MEGENESVLEMVVRICLELQEFELAKIYCEDLLKINENNFNVYLLMTEIYPYYDRTGKFMEYVEKRLKSIRNPRNCRFKRHGAITHMTLMNSLNAMSMH